MTDNTLIKSTRLGHVVARGGSAGGGISTVPTSTTTSTTVTLRSGKGAATAITSSSDCPSLTLSSHGQTRKIITSSLHRPSESFNNHGVVSSLPLPSNRYKSGVDAPTASRRTTQRPGAVSPSPLRVRTQSSNEKPGPQINTKTAVSTASFKLEERPATSLEIFNPEAKLRPRASSDLGPSSPLTVHDDVTTGEPATSPCASSPSPDSAVSGVLEPLDSLGVSLLSESPSSPSRAGHASTTSQESLTSPDDAETVQGLNNNSPESPTKRVILAAQRRRELLLPKAISASDTSNDQRRSSHYHHVPLKYLNGTTTSPISTTPVRVPPIRGFRSSGSRKSSLSLISDMNYASRSSENGDDNQSINGDQTLRGFEARLERDMRRMTPPVSGRNSTANGDDSGDVFLKIAREEAYRRADGDRPYGGSYTPVSGVGRSGHRRPLSTNLASYQPISPPKLARRLSDQQERPNLRSLEDDQISQLSRSNTYRIFGREKAASSHPAEDLSRARLGGGVSLRQAPVAPRSPVYQENGADALRHTRRRASITESTPPVSGRQYKSAAFGHGHSKTFSSSPLVQSFDLRSQRAQEGANLMEGTESTASTAAPSTVWDELDDLKSRIHRLELTGKLPPTSAAAVARLADERPATATTTITTASLSPKRQPALPLDTQSIVSTTQQRDVHPLLQTALSKSRHLLSLEVYQALECAAQDAMGLSQMMGSVGQPGPISSGASTIGSTNTITDRQLRRKADSVCRSLTELCLALNDDAGQAMNNANHMQSNLEHHRGTPTTPTMSRSISGLPISRRPSATAEQGLPQSHSSSRVISKFEERRNSLFQAAAPPVSLHGNLHSPAPGEQNASRRSSLLISRSRRAQTDEPEEGRDSPFLRSRRAETEELDEGRKTNFLVRNRRGTMEDQEQPRLSSPIRPRTDNNAMSGSGYSPESQTASADNESVVSSGLPRRRFASDLHSARVSIPAGPANATHQRKYLDRAAPDRDISTRTPDYGVTRRISMHTKANSLGSRRANRESMIPMASSSANTGGPK